MANESAIRCCTSADRDIETVTARSIDEGLPFLTVVLPDFGKAIQKWLDLRKVDRTMVTSFSYHKGLPRFLGGFLDLIFDRDSGVMFDEPSIDAVLAVRQLTLLFSKTEFPITREKEQAAFDKFIESESVVRSFDKVRTPIDLERFRRMSFMLFGKMFQELDRQIYYHENMMPKHGPGATADRLMGNRKYDQNVWTERLEEYFPAGEYLLPSWSYYDNLEKVDYREPGSEIPVKVITVPKTFKTPRIIGMEPTAMQYCQQTLLPVILDGISRYDYLDTMLGFDDQTPNQEMAQSGSASGQLATLDLSDASDRVSNQLVREMLAQFPHLGGAIDACRSRKANVPGHGVVRLAKFASMGSALCFPMEAMIFLVMVFLGIEESHITPLKLKDVKRLQHRVRIYGDDIIVPVEYVHTVVRSLEHFGAKVNAGKSYWNSTFRESCGKEYFMGHDVSIVKVRQVFPAQRQDATEVISTVSLRNQLYFAGYWQTVKWLDREIRKVLIHFPTVSPTSTVLGRHSFLGYETQRMHATLHSPLVKGYTVRAQSPKNPLGGEGALLKFHIARGKHPMHDKRHLERSGRPLTVNIKLGNSQPF